MSYLRMFVAIELPCSVRSALHAMQPKVASVRGTTADNLHLTLHFIGLADPEPLKQALAPLSGALAPFTLELSGVGHFSGRGRSLILWAGVQLSPELLRVHSEIGRLLTAAGVAVELRPYCPHVTIARGQNVLRSDVNDFLNAYRDYSATVTVDSVCLVSSLPQHGGSIYTVEQRYQFAEPPR